jgi:hypothetical protein
MASSPYNPPDPDQTTSSDTAGGDEPKVESYDNEVEVFVRWMRFTDADELDGGEAPVVVVTTFLLGRMDEREIYDHHGELMACSDPNRAGS